jgi:hypothetical protein
MLARRAVIVGVYDEAGSDSFQNSYRSGVDYEQKLIRSPCAEGRTASKKQLKPVGVSYFMLKLNVSYF